MEERAQASPKPADPPKHNVPISEQKSKSPSSASDGGAPPASETKDGIDDLPPPPPVAVSPRSRSRSRSRSRTRRRSDRGRSTTPPRRERDRRPREDDSRDRHRRRRRTRSRSREEEDSRRRRTDHRRDRDRDRDRSRSRSRDRRSYRRKSRRSRSRSRSRTRSCSRDGGGYDRRAHRRTTRRRRSYSRSRSRSRNRGRSSPLPYAKPSVGDVGAMIPAIALAQTMPFMPSGVPINPSRPNIPVKMPILPPGVPLINPATRSQRRLYVGGIPNPCIDMHLIEFLSSTLLALGLVASTGRFPIFKADVTAERGFAFVEFYDIADCTACLQLDGIIYNGQPLRLRRPRDFVAPPGHMEPPPLGPMAIATMLAQKSGQPLPQLGAAVPGSGSAIGGAPSPQPAFPGV